MEEDSLATDLANYSKGVQRDVDLLIRQLQLPSCKDKFMVDKFMRIKNCILVLEHDKYGAVVMELLKVHWSNRSAEVVRSYHMFIVNLVSAHPTYTPAVLSALVSLFMPRRNESGANLGALLGETEIELRKKYEEEMRHVHTTLASVIKSVPTSVQTLSKIIQERFPYILHKDGTILEMYVQNILHVTIYCPTIRPSVLYLVVEKMINLDVRASRELIEEADETDSEDDEMFDMEEEATSREMKNAQNKLTEADRLDTIMCIVFNYIDKTCRNADSSLNWEATKKLYLELLTLFEKIILPTHECCHTQYLLFYICSLKQNLADGFMDYLWKKVKNPNEHQIYRKSAICYLASFIVRASYISIRSAADAIALLCEWIHKYVGAAHHNSMQCDIAHHGTFYTVVQAVFYILAFRQKEFLDMDKADNFFMGLSLQTIVTCKLNPLKVCQPVITRTFASFVRKHQLAFCDAIIERNSRLMVPTTDITGNSSTLNQHLESYFPFDPYLLIRSSGRIVDMYRTFDGTAIIDMTPSKDNDDGEDEFVEESKGMSVDTYYGKSPVDVAFLGSISPGFNAPVHSLR